MMIFRFFLSPLSGVERVLFTFSVYPIPRMLKISLLLIPLVLGKIGGTLPFFCRLREREEQSQKNILRWTQKSWDKKLEQKFNGRNHKKQKLS